MSMEVRSENGTGKFLFEWDPDIDTISILLKGVLYRVKLIKQGTKAIYHIVDKRPKP